MEQRRRLTANAVAIFFTLLVLCVTLYPFEFTTVGLTERINALQVQKFSKLKGLVDDVVTNIILFIPVGFSFGLVYGRKERRRIVGLLVVTLAGLAMSTCVEFLQLYTPFRFSSYFDILSNGFGAAIGFGISVAVGNPFLTSLLSLLSPKRQRARFAVLYGGWWVFFLLLVFPLSYALRVNDWDKKTPLTVGSNADGSERISGTLAYFGLTKMGMSEWEVTETLARGSLAPKHPSDIVAEYHLNGKPPYPSLTKHSTSLVRNQQGILHTKSAFTHPASWIMFTTVFTAYIDYHLTSPPTGGEETLVLLGRDSDDVSFAIRRAGDELIVALRSMVTGYTANHPAYVIPGFFSTPGRYRILVTHDQLRLRVYKNEPHSVSTFEMGPGLALINRFLPTRSRLNITSPFSGINEWILAGLAFAPLGFFAGRTLRCVPTLRARAVLASFMLLAPVVTINYACGYMMFRPFDITYSTLCAGIMMATMMFAIVLTRRKAIEQGVNQAPVISEPSIVHEHCS